MSAASRPVRDRVYACRYADTGLRLGRRRCENGDLILSSVDGRDAFQSTRYSRADLAWAVEGLSTEDIEWLVARLARLLPAAEEEGSHADR